MRENIVEAIKRSLTEAFPGATSLEISNYSKSDSDQLCHINNIGVAKTVLNLIANPQPLRVNPTSIQTDDFFLLYRGSNGSK
jgi:hypothetical protein